MDGFDSNKYLEEEYKAILDRISKFNGKLYLEIGGQLLFDRHASSVLPGFDPTVKVKILKKFDNIEFLFCVNSEDFVSDRPLENGSKSYIEKVLEMIEKLKETFNNPIHIVVNKIPHDNEPTPVTDFISLIKSKGYLVYKRYMIEGYPHNTNKVLSIEGYGHDEYIVTSSKLVVVTGPGSNSGKLSTCLGQIYLDKLKGLESGYAKYELFPIWNLPLNHPINLAYEAATADIGDYNEEDVRYEKINGRKAVNYNRDVEAFEILESLGKRIVSENNFIHSYRSPTDMGINMAGFCIKDDKICGEAAIKEIENRLKGYENLLTIGKGKAEWVSRTQDILLKAKSNL
jgi:uncharacterized protein (UPF0371 family)